MDALDLIIISGLPRSGTTYIHNALARYGKKSNIFGIRNVVRNSRFCDLELEDHQYVETDAFYDSPYFSNFLPDYKLPHWITSEPAICNTYNGDLTDIVLLLLKHWRIKLSNPTLTVIYKHPQASFRIPLTLPNNKILYIICNREKENWKNAVIKDKFTDSVDINAGAPWVKANWGKEWKEPIELDDRLNHLYTIWNTINNKILSDPNLITFEFSYENPERDTNKILSYLNLKEFVKDAIKNWKPLNKKGQ